MPYTQWAGVVFMRLTIAYLTNRKEPRFEWFWKSLINQNDGIVSNVVVVSFHDISNQIKDAIGASANIPIKHGENPLGFIRVVQPKPSVWQGKHRLTREDYFSACNTRNTALCYADDGYIAYVDDLSVLMPGWLKCVKEAMDGNYIALGTYEKVKNLVVKDGIATSYESYHGGMDSRRSLVKGLGACSCTGDWMYGCSIAMPVEAALTVNGWPEDLADGMGSEDYLMGIVLGNAGYHLKYDTRMLTLESEELHHQGTPFKRSDFGISPNDKSHSALAIARQSKYFPNSFGEGGIRALRDRILVGGEFPIPKSPDREWWTGRLLSEL